MTMLTKEASTVLDRMVTSVNGGGGSMTYQRRRDNGSNTVKKVNERSWQKLQAYTVSNPLSNIQ